MKISSKQQPDITQFPPPLRDRQTTQKPHDYLPTSPFI